MSSLLDFKDYYYLKGNNVNIVGTGGLKVPEGLTVERPFFNKANIRFNIERNCFEFGLEDDWLYLSNISGNSSWLLASGDTLKGILELDDNARIILSNGTNKEPVIAFDNDKDSGVVFYNNANYGFVVDGKNETNPILRLYKDSTKKVDINADVFTQNVEVDRILAKNNNNIQYTFSKDTNSGIFKKDNGFGFIAGKNKNDIEIASIERTGNNDNDGYLKVNTRLLVDTINSMGNDINIESTKSLVVPKGNISQRPNNIGGVRFNTETNSFEFIFGNEVLTFSTNKNNSTYVSKSGDIMFGNLTMSNANILLSDGSSGEPSLSFRSDDNSGLYFDSSIKTIALTTGNATPNVRFYSTSMNNYIKIDSETTIDKKLFLNDSFYVNNQLTEFKTQNYDISGSNINIKSNNVNITNSLNLNRNSNKNIYSINVYRGNSINTTLSYDTINNFWEFGNKIISGVRYPEEDSHSANKKYVDDNITNSNNQYNQDISEERERAIREEQRIESKFDESFKDQEEINVGFENQINDSKNKISQNQENIENNKTNISNNNTEISNLKDNINDNIEDIQDLKNQDNIIKDGLTRIENESKSRDLGINTQISKIKNDTLGSLIFGGMWDANGNYPDKPSVPTYWVVENASNPVVKDGISYTNGDKLLYSVLVVDEFDDNGDPVTYDGSFSKLSKGSGVESVNGKKGNVTLSANDVDAYTKTEIDNMFEELAQAFEDASNDLE